jgi:hypothetical protein
VQRLQKSKLLDHEEPEKTSGPAGDPEILQHLPETHRAQRSEMKPAIDSGE